MTDYVSFFLNAQGGVIQLDCIEIAHSSFPEVFRYVRNDTSGITVKHEDGLDYFYEFQQMEIGRNNITNDLDQVFIAKFLIIYHNRSYGILNRF